MIKAQDLRVGNWINYKGEPIRVTMIGEYGVQSKSDTEIINGKFVTPDLTPIPLSNEVLLACGFTKDGFGGYDLPLPKTLQASNAILYFASDYLYLRHKNNDNPFDDSICTLWNKDLMKVFYLHELQNLFWCLTKTELEYKPLNTNTP